MSCVDDGDTKRRRLTTGTPEEEGGYGWEYISNSHGAEGGKQEAHQPLGEAGAIGSFDEEGHRILIEYGSRCEQYGGHWKGHKCVGARNGGNHGPEVVKNICIFDWWNPVGWVCGAAAAGKAAYEAANK
jgi:hypothetical protein